MQRLQLDHGEVNQGCRTLEGLNHFELGVEGLEELTGFSSNEDARASGGEERDSYFHSGGAVNLKILKNRYFQNGKI